MRKEGNADLFIKKSAPCVRHPMAKQPPVFVEECLFSHRMPETEA